MIRQRVRIRFRKEGDLRLISHRDLVRTFERLFRRAGVRLSMSEGFHPKARMNFPSALGLGIQGIDEVMEVELAEEVLAEELLERFQRLTPAGLAITLVQTIPAGTPKPQPTSMSYEIRVPEALLADVDRSIKQLLSTSEHLIHRDGRKEPIDLHAGLERLELSDDTLQLTLRASRTASVRPREVLEALQLEDLESQGAFLSRTSVELTS